MHMSHFSKNMLSKSMSVLASVSMLGVLLVPSVSQAKDNDKKNEPAFAQASAGEKKGWNNVGVVQCIDVRDGIRIVRQSQ